MIPTVQKCSTAADLGGISTEMPQDSFGCSLVSFLSQGLLQKLISMGDGMVGAQGKTKFL